MQVQEEKPLEGHVIYPPKFSLGRIVATPAALYRIKELGHEPSLYLQRHQGGDWGDCCDEDKASNDAALENGTRLLSVYATEKGKLWVITEWDRSVTTILLPEEY